MKKSYLLALLAVAYLEVAGGFDFIAIDYLTETVSPAALAFIRVTICAVVLLAVLLLKEHKFHIDKRDWPRIFLGGALGMGIYYIFEAMGIARTSASLASLIVATVPLFGMIGDRIVYKNKMSPGKIIGVLCSIAGVAVVIAGNKTADFSGSMIGILCMFLSAVSWVAYIIIVKPLNEKYSILHILAGLFLSGSIVALPAFLWNEPAQLLQLSGMGWSILLISSILCLALAQLFYVYGISRLSVTTTSIMMNLLPIVTILFSFILFGEMLSGMQLLGGAVILISVTIVSIKDANYSAESDCIH